MTTNKTAPELRALIAETSTAINSLTSQRNKYEDELAYLLSPFKPGDTVRKERWPDYEVINVRMKDGDWAIDCRKIKMDNGHPIEMTFNAKDKLAKVSASQLLALT